MAYTKNPAMPRLRAKAVEMVRSGKSVRQVARYFGYSPGTISKWCKRAPMPGVFRIETLSSRPNSHPNDTPHVLVRRALELRQETGGRCAEVVHEHLRLEGVIISLSTVKRILDRAGVTKKRSPWKRKHKSISRPKALHQGDLVQIDTIHIMQNEKDRIYIYTLLDVHSRWAHALASERINTHRSLHFVRQAIKNAPFEFRCLQSDNGPEFTQNFTERIKIIHRHSRVRKPNDNAHLERFNRTIQHEFLSKMPVNVSAINRELPKYLAHYNTCRLHLGIGLKTPMQIISKCFQAID